MKIKIRAPWRSLPELPGWLSSDLSAALQNPGEDVLGAILAAGRLLRWNMFPPRVSELRALRKWAAQIPDALCELAQGYAEDVFKEASSKICRGRGYVGVYRHIQSRDDVASLQYILRLAVDGRRTAARLLCYQEVAAMASRWDAVGEQQIGELKHIVARHPIPQEFIWLGELALTEPESWWLNVIFFVFATRKVIKNLPRFLREDGS